MSNSVGQIEHVASHPGTDLDDWMMGSFYDQQNHLIENLGLSDSGYCDVCGADPDRRTILE